MPYRFRVETPEYYSGTWFLTFGVSSDKYDDEDPDEKRKVHGMILGRLSSQDTCYQRIAWFSSEFLEEDPPFWWEQFDKATVRII
jgi:hypothetical protein